MKKLMPWIAATIVVGSFFTLPAPAAESLSVLFQKGIYAEETEGNVDAAIKIYQQIAAEAAANRTVVAQAQYRLALCYQKKGNQDQAIKLLNELVQQSPADVDLSKKARDTLRDMGGQLAVASAIRQITLPFPVKWFWDVSADGRYIPCQTDDLIVCEIATGKSWTIRRGPFVGRQQPDSVVISPDGKWIAYDFGFSGIHVARIDGSESRIVFETKDPNDVLSLDIWSRDGSQLIADISSKNTQSPILNLITLDVRTGAKKDVIRRPGSLSGPWWLSASGRYIARLQTSYPRKISIFDVQTDHEDVVLDRDVGQVVGWASGDTKLLFTKSSASGLDLWSVAVKDGKIAGDDKLLLSDLGEVRPLGVTRDGDIFYSAPWNKQGPKDLWVMEGFLSRKGAPPVAFQLEISPEEFFVSDQDHTVLDRKLGVTFQIPADWIIRSAALVANSGGRMRTIQFRISEPGVAASVRYHMMDPWGLWGAEFPLLHAAGPKPNTAEEVDAWLRRFAQGRNEGLAKREAAAVTFTLSPEGLVARTINGRRTLVWSQIIRRKTGESQVEFMSISLSEKVGASLWLQGPEAKTDALRATFDAWLASLQLQ